MQRLEDFLGAERELFDAHSHGVLNGVGDRCRGPETGWFRHGARPERAIFRGDLHQNIFDRGHVRGHRHEIGCQRRIENLAVFDHYLFGHGTTDALHGAAIDLPFDGHRIDRHADVLGLHETHHTHLACILVHSDFRRLRAEDGRKGHRRERGRAHNRAGCRGETHTG